MSEQKLDADVFAAFWDVLCPGIRVTNADYRHYAPAIAAAVLRAERPGWRPLAWAVLTEEGQLFSVHTSERNAQMAFGSASREIVPLIALHPSVAEGRGQLEDE